jgi:hypothetical protein
MGSPELTKMANFVGASNSTPVGPVRLTGPPTGAWAHS